MLPGLSPGLRGDDCERQMPGTFCPNQCSGNGQCDGGFCRCGAGWWGADCSLPSGPLLAPAVGAAAGGGSGGGGGGGGGATGGATEGGVTSLVPLVQSDGGLVTAARRRARLLDMGAARQRATPPVMELEAAQRPARPPGAGAYTGPLFSST